MIKSEYPLLHIYSQSAARTPIEIVGNTEGLVLLLNCIIDAFSPTGKGDVEVFCADAEGFQIQVKRDDSDEAWETLKLPYTK